LLHERWLHGFCQRRFDASSSNLTIHLRKIPQKIQCTISCEEFLEKSKEDEDEQEENHQSKTFQDIRDPCEGLTCVLSLCPHACFGGAQGFPAAKTEEVNEETNFVNVGFWNSKMHTQFWVENCGSPFRVEEQQCTNSRVELWTQSERVVVMEGGKLFDYSPVAKTKHEKN